MLQPHGAQEQYCFWDRSGAFLRARESEDAPALAVKGPSEKGPPHGVPASRPGSAGGCAVLEPRRGEPADGGLARGDVAGSALERRDARGEARAWNGATGRLGLGCSVSAAQRASERGFPPDCGEREGERQPPQRNRSVW